MTNSSSRLPVPCFRFFAHPNKYMPVNKNENWNCKTKKIGKKESKPLYSFLLETRHANSCHTTCRSSPEMMREFVGAFIFMSIQVIMLFIHISHCALAASFNLESAAFQGSRKSKYSRFFNMGTFPNCGNTNDIYLKWLCLMNWRE